jgi:two-component system response regulator DctR
MPGKSGLQLLKELRSRDVDIPVIAMTGFADVPMAVEALQLGAVNFVEKPFKNQVLIDQVNACMVQAGELWSVRQRRMAFKKQLETLTERERETLQLMVTGASSKEIGRVLGISHRTVHVHRSRILSKFDVPSAFELALRLREVEADSRGTQPPATHKE